MTTSRTARTTTERRVCGSPKDYMGKDVNVNNFLAVLLSDRSAFIFESLLPENIDAYATTAGNVEESSWGTY